MMKFVSTAAAATLLASAALADIAVSESTTGVIVAFDSANRTLVLNDGSQFELLPTVDTAEIVVGKQARVGFNRIDGRPVAAAVFTAYYPLVLPVAPTVDPEHTSSDVREE
ncbi:MAG: hypothetical protein U1E56_07210 [Bauldia sp.]